jgi:A118 family predicted phage portal protein
MGLPTENMRWIPQAHLKIYTDYAEHEAWYSGSPERLANFYAGVIYPTQTLAGDFFSDIYNNTVAPRQKFWGKQIYEERRTMLHIPIAKDLASTSSDLLFGESPKIRIAEAHEENADADAIATQERLDEMIAKGDIQNKLLEAAETSAALGGVFLKINWDSEIAPHPVLSIAQPDSAFPEFEWGALKAITFWKVIREEETKKESLIFRLLERHEKGKILYGLYKGTHDYLGMRIGLGALPETAGLQDEIPTGIDDILVRYVANIRPNKKFRGSSYGQSDYAGLEGLMDALDEVYSSWMRDIRLGQGRIMIPESFMQRLPNGNLAFDVDREIYTLLDVNPIAEKDVGITMNQFDIRTEQHKQTALELTNRIISSAGYSPQTFGLSIAGSAESGTALNIRERKSFITKAKKERYWKPALEDIFRMLLEVDSIHFGTRIVVYQPKVEFQDSITNDITQTSAAVDTLARAQSVSIATKVRMVHPDWNDTEVEIEVNKIKEENGLTVPDAFQLGMG